MLALMAVAVFVVLCWLCAAPAAELPRLQDDAGPEAGRRFADAVEAMRFEEAEAQAQRWFLLADHRDPPPPPRPDQASGERMNPRRGGWPPPPWPSWWA